MPIASSFGRALLSGRERCEASRLAPLALVMIVGLPIKASTSRVEPQIPRARKRRCAVLYQGCWPAVDVAAEFSRGVAASATSALVSVASVSRSCQVPCASDDLGRRSGEAVRLAFGFGVDARVVSPSATVRAARELAAHILKAHESADRSCRSRGRIRKGHV
jgi:hypothetical protein